jgi:hypothetical protein
MSEERKAEGMKIKPAELSPTLCRERESHWAPLGKSNNEFFIPAVRMFAAGYAFDPHQSSRFI